MEQTRYGMRRTVDLSYEDAVTKVRETLEEQSWLRWIRSRRWG